MSKPAVACESIFPISGEHPDRTYVERSAYSSQLIDAIRSNQIGMVYGVSKCGKTLLVKYVLGTSAIPYVWIYGNEIEDAEYFWELLNQLTEPLERARKKNKASYRANILDRLRSAPRCIVIDDFHYIASQKVRLDTLHILKMLNGERIPIVIIGVQSPQLREVELLQDMKGRIRSIEISSWSETDLIRIASKGFSTSGTAVMQLARLAQESFGSPFIMQLLCQLYCKHRLEAHLGSKPGYIDRVEPEDLNLIFPEAVSSFSYSQLYNLLVHPANCIVETVFTRHDGKHGNLNQMILYAISGLYPLGSIPLTTCHIGILWQRMRQILHPESTLPDDNLLFSGIELMCNQYYKYYFSTLETYSRHDPAIDLTGQVFHVRDAFIIFYLRHSTEVEGQFWG